VTYIDIHPCDTALNKSRIRDHWCQQTKKLTVHMPTKHDTSLRVHIICAMLSRSLVTTAKWVRGSGRKRRTLDTRTASSILSGQSWSPATDLASAHRCFRCHEIPRTTLIKVKVQWWASTSAERLSASQREQNPIKLVGVTIATSNLTSWAYRSKMCSRFTVHLTTVFLPHSLHHLMIRW
jgi:hypothetical protein